MNMVWDIEISSKALDKTYVNIDVDLGRGDRDMKIRNVQTHISPFSPNKLGCLVQTVDRSILNSKNKTQPTFLKCSLVMQQDP